MKNKKHFKSDLKLILQPHVHSNRSHDSAIPIKKYVDFLHKHTRKNELTVIGITDHHVLPITTKKALELSTKKVIVVPGIQWRLHKTLFESLTKLSTRRDLLTLGNHDSLRNYIKNKTPHSLFKNEEISNLFTEKEFLNYISENNKKLILICPHPKHIGFDYYGKKEIKELLQHIKQNNFSIPFFVEEKTGYDPFPRIFTTYKGKYPILGASDAHEIYSILKTNSLLSVETSIPCNIKIFNLWAKTMNGKNLILYKKILKNIFELLEVKNDEISIKKYYFRAYPQFISGIPRWFKRRFENFPHNLFT